MVLVDGHGAVLSALAQRLGRLDDLEVVGETESFSRGLDMSARLRPALIVADFGAGGAYAAARCARARQASPDSKIVVFTPYADGEMRRMYTEAGANACLLKDIGFDALVKELRALLSTNGATLVSPPAQRVPGSGE